MALTYDEAVEYIYELPRHTTKHSFTEGREFLDRLGAPDTGMKVIHVAGTNGKGSVCAYMESILMHAHLKTGCFVSPHLVDCRERIRIDGRMCSQDAFMQAFERVYELGTELYMPTFFEFLFFMAMLIFAAEAPDVVILETGLGGRLDATNLVRDKLVSVITSIGYDHMEYLGDSLEQIAAEKAGICASGRPVVYWSDCPGAKEISRIARESESVEVALPAGIISDIHRENGGIDFCLRYKYDSYICPHIGTHALYQVDNAAIAVCALMETEEFRSRLTENDYVCGLGEMYWPGRMEEVEERLILDGAHNEPGIEAFTRSVRGDGALSRLLVFGCMQDKAYLREIDILAGSGLFDRVVTVTVDSHRAESAQQIADKFRQAGMEAEPAPDAAEALKAAREYIKTNGYYAYITGSLYLVGEIRGLRDDRF